MTYDVRSIPFHLQLRPAVPTSSTAPTGLAASTDAGSAMVTTTAWTRATKPSAVSSPLLFLGIRGGSLGKASDRGLKIQRTKVRIPASGAQTNL